MPFNKDFNKDNDAELIGSYRQTGCFNWHCRAPNPTKRCSRCGVAVYCSQECQKADWKDKDDPHKNLCQIYCNNTKPENWTGDEEGQEFPVPVGLAAIGILDKDLLWDLMKVRADAFLEEVNRIYSIGEANGEKVMKDVWLNVNVMYNLDRPILQASVRFSDPTATGKSPFHKEAAHYILFVPVGEGGESVRRRLHPLSGSGEITDEMRQTVLEELKEFICKINESGIPIGSINYSRGLMWMSEGDFKNGGAKELVEANGGNWIGWMPDMRYAYAMEDSMIAAMSAFWG